MFLHELQRTYSDRRDSVVPICPDSDVDTKGLSRMVARSSRMVARRGQNMESDPGVSKPDRDWFSIEGSFLPRPRTLVTMDSATYYQGSCIGQRSSVNEIRTTLVFPCTYEQLRLIEETEVCRKWADPIIVPYFRHRDDIVDHAMEELIAEWKGTCPHLLLIAVDPQGEGNSRIDNRANLYPRNLLRNIGLTAVRTSHVLVTDIHFIPSNSLDETIRSALFEHQHFRMQRSRTQYGQMDGPFEYDNALLIPTFDQRQGDACKGKAGCERRDGSQPDVLVPRLHNEVKACFSNNTLGCSGEGWLQGQSEETTNATSAQMISCVHETPTEPTIVVPWCPLKSLGLPRAAIKSPFYDERFDAASIDSGTAHYFEHLRHMGFRFSILPRGFFIRASHTTTNHTGSSNKIQQVLEPRERERVKQQEAASPPTTVPDNNRTSSLFGMDQFTEELKWKYADRLGQVVPSCVGARSKFQY